MVNKLGRKDHPEESMRRAQIGMLEQRQLLHSLNKISELYERGKLDEVPKSNLFKNLFKNHEIFAHFVL